LVALRDAYITLAAEPEHPIAIGLHAQKAEALTEIIKHLGRFRQQDLSEYPDLKDMAAAHRASLVSAFASALRGKAP